VKTNVKILWLARFQYRAMPNLEARVCVCVCVKPLTVDAAPTPTLVMAPFLTFLSGSNLNFHEIFVLQILYLIMRTYNSNY
jgi:hypothetical protein